MKERIERFEDLIAWQKARVWAGQIYKMTFEGKFATDFVLSRQIRGAALSVPSNIAEGFERGNRNEFHQFLSIAKSSCAEVRSDLYTALDIGYLEEERFTLLLHDAEEVARIIGGLRRAVSQQRTGRKTQSSVLSPEFAPVAEFGRRTGLKIRAITDLTR